jgi:thiol-disulfide isomerase/thioredoxin
MVPQIKALLTYTLPDNAIERTIKVFNTALVSSLPSEDKEEIRKQTLKLYQELAERTTSPSQEKRAESQINYLQGAFATGTLVGNKAPALHFKWISNGKETSLDDFKGKVVMIDFWATKCAPCISSFPEIAALQEHYKNSPVAIIGVTSIMGYFVDTPNKRTVNTANAPEKETALMPPYMKNMGMTWRVAFTEEDVMNVQYGVLAIPHVTILDKEGRVRYNNVSGTNEEKIKLIDSLLNE